MKRLGMLFSGLVVCVFLCSPALADPKESFRPRVAETGGRIYALLQGCVDMELEAKGKVEGK